MEAGCNIVVDSQIFVLLLQMAGPVDGTAVSMSNRSAIACVPYSFAIECRQYRLHSAFALRGLYLPVNNSVCTRFIRHGSPTLQQAVDATIEWAMSQSMTMAETRQHRSYPSESIQFELEDVTFTAKILRIGYDGGLHLLQYSCGAEGTEWVELDWVNQLLNDMHGHSDVPYIHI